jgi:hypothetical protein
MLRMISRRQLPALNDRNGWRAIDILHAKGAILQHGESLILTERGKWALGLGTQRVVVYQRKGKERTKVDDILAEIPLDESLAMDIEELCEHEDMRFGGLDEAVFEDLKHDCLDYYKDWKIMPEPQAVQAWGEVVYVKVSQRQAQSIVKAAEKELTNG